MKKLAIRYFWFIIGMLINSFGIACITKANLGTSQISGIPYILSLQFHKFTFGEFTFLFNMLLILLQLILLKRDFKPFQFLQIGATIVFSYFIDVSMQILSGFQPSNIILCLLSLLIGCAILAIGISIEVAPNVLMVPGEAIVKALALVTDKKFGTVKIFFDITLIAIAVVLSFFFFKQLNGIGLGTILSAILVGRLVNYCNARFPIIEKFWLYNRIQAWLGDVSSDSSLR